MGHMSPRLKARRGRFGAGGLDPTVNITSPANNTVLTASVGSPFSALASFTGVATDPEDGDISSSIVWSSSIDGSLGTGAAIGGSPQVLLTQGVHTITAQAVPSSGSPIPVVTDEITVTVST